MARLKDRNKSLTLRLKGMSYSQIKEKLGISKSTLHYWLKDYPLSEERIRELRDWNHIRIEKFRQTMARKKNKRLESVRAQVEKTIGKLNERELFLAGLFLYWGEGAKTMPYKIMLSNTDPNMLQFFMKWVALLGVHKSQIKARLHLYKDMNIAKQTELWSEMLDLPVTSFRNTYIKDVLPNKLRNYNKGRFGFGTCHLWVGGRDLHERVLTALEIIRESHHLPKFA